MMIFILLFFVGSCHDIFNNCKNLPEQTVGTGEIVQDALIWFDLTTSFIFNSNEGHIITSDSENIFDLKVSFNNGTSYHPIDFTQYTVLGKKAEGDCRVFFVRNVTKNVGQKKYIYKITAIHCGDCQKLAIGMNWVLIPKIEDDFSVEFIVDYQRWKGK